MIVFHLLSYTGYHFVFAQVINTLQRAVDCNKRQALDYATIVDREVISVYLKWVLSV